ncbi:acid protease [Mollisia scopiformis]|uniref:Acid protease n=1 Tax=Mollisia scopiformis TaxID=149040 RepID=A0A194WX26_MOLSC|nr:acid protease [Mollisia scopiformis]KUJ12533.1 acid protease [Mollisia scopiformis]
MSVSTLTLALLASAVAAVPHGSPGTWNRNAAGCGEIILPMDDSVHGAAFNISLGTPPQTVTLLADWTWQITWVDTPDCYGNYSVANCIPKGQNFFNDQASTSFVDDKSQQTQEFLGTDYTPGMEFRNDFGADKLCFHSDANNADLCSNSVEISVSNFTSELPVIFDVGGVFGFAPVAPGYNDTFMPTAYQMWKQGLLGPNNGWHMCGGLKDLSTCYGKKYLTILGGTDTTVYDTGKTHHHPTSFSKCLNSGPHLTLSPPRYNYWSTEWTNFFIGQESFSLRAKDSLSYNATTADPECDGIDAIAVWDQDKFGYGAAMPFSAFDTLVSLTDAHIAYNNNTPGLFAVNSGNASVWAVDCSKVSTFPTLTYEFSHLQNITVVPAMYIDTSMYPGQCLLNARPWDRAIEGAQTFFGLTILSRTHLEFNFETNMIGISPLNSNLYE